MRNDPNLWAYCFLLMLGMVTAVEHFAPLPAPSAPSEACRVSYVVDGDTVHLLCGGEKRPARLMGFDAPELHDPKCASERRAAEASRAALRGLIGQAARIEIESHGRDKYRRSLIRLRLDGVDVATPMIAKGHARAYDGGARGGWCR